MEELINAMSVDNVPAGEGIHQVVIGIAVIVGFLVVLLTMYTAVLERTREIGILKALGASPGYILGILMRESILLAVMRHHRGHRHDVREPMADARLRPSFAEASDRAGLVAEGCGLISLIGAVLGAIYPGPEGRAAGRYRGSVL